MKTFSENELNSSIFLGEVNVFEMVCDTTDKDNRKQAYIEMYLLIGL